MTSSNDQGSVAYWRRWKSGQSRRKGRIWSLGVRGREKWKSDQRIPGMERNISKDQFSLIMTITSQEIKRLKWRTEFFKQVTVIAAVGYTKVNFVKVPGMCCHSVFLKFMLLKYSWVIMLCSFLPYSKVFVIHIYILFDTPFHYGLLQDIEYSSLGYTVGPCCLSILYIIVCIC